MRAMALRVATGGSKEVLAVYNGPWCYKQNTNQWHWCFHLFPHIRMTCQLLNSDLEIVMSETTLQKITEFDYASKPGMRWQYYIVVFYLRFKNRNSEQKTSCPSWGIGNCMAWQLTVVQQAGIF